MTEKKANVSRIPATDEKEARERGKLLGVTWKKVKKKVGEGKDAKEVEEQQRVDRKVKVLEVKRAKDTSNEWLVAWVLED